MGPFSKEKYPSGPLCHIPSAQSVKLQVRTDVPPTLCCHGPARHMCGLFLTRHSVCVNIHSSLRSVQLRTICWSTSESSDILRQHDFTVSLFNPSKAHNQSAWHIKIQFVLHREHTVLQLERPVSYWGIAKAWTFSESMIQGKIFSVHAMNTYKGNRGTVPRILNLCSRWRWLASRPRQFTPTKELQNSLSVRVGGPHSRARHFLST